MASVPQTTLTWLWNVLNRNQYDPNQSYRDPNRTYHDVVRVLAQYPSFGPRTDVYTYENGFSTLLLHLVGTLPVTFRGTVYNFPLDVWIPHAYPFDPPIVYVTPTSDMVVRVGQHVTLEGKVYHHYLAHWAEAWDRSSIIDLLTVLREVFSKEPPVKYKPQHIQTPRTQPAPPPVPPLPAELASTPVSTSQHRPQQQQQQQQQQQRQEASPQPPEPPPKPGQQSPQSSWREAVAANAPTPVSSPPAPPLPPKEGDGGRKPYRYHANGSIERTQVLQGPSGRTAPGYRQDQYQNQHTRHASVQYSAPAQYAAGHAPHPAPDPRFHYHQNVQPPYPLSPHSPTASAQHVSRTQPGPPPPPPPHPQGTATAAAARPPRPPPTTTTTQAQPPKQETPDLLTSPFELELPSISPTEPPPPVPPNPEKGALLQALSQTLTETLQANISQARSAQTPLQSQAQALHRAMATLQNEINSLTDFQKTLQSNITVLQQSLHRADAVIADARSRISTNNPPPSTAPSSPTTTTTSTSTSTSGPTTGLPPIDEVLVPPTVVGKQLYDLVAEERGIEQAIYALQTALAKGVITTETWSKHTRSLAREAFMKKALIRKIGKGMGLE